MAVAMCAGIYDWSATFYGLAGVPPPVLLALRTPRPARPSRACSHCHRHRVDMDWP